VNESCHTCKWVMSHVWMSHVTHMNESCHTCEWVMARLKTSPTGKFNSLVTHVNESCHTCGWLISHTWRSHITRVNESSHGEKIKRDVDKSTPLSHMWMGHVTHVNGSCHTCEWVMSWKKNQARRGHINPSGEVISHMWMSYLHRCRGHVCISYVTRVNLSCHTCECGMSCRCMSYVTQMNQSCGWGDWSA